MKTKITAIIQARMSSTRLPGKVLQQINNKPMLEHVINQTKHSKFINEIIIATTNSNEDDKIVDFCKNKNIKYFRGLKNDVLDRYYKCSKKFNCSIIVRITSDCPLIDPDIIDKGINIFLKKSLDYIGNNIEYKDKRWINATCNFPQGMTVEVCTYDMLRKAWKEATKPSEREHVFPYVQSNPKNFCIDNFKNNIDLSFIRCTVDRKEDLKFVKEIYNRLKNNKIIHINDIVKVVTKHKDLLDINTKIPFDEGYRISLKKDITEIINGNKSKISSQKLKVVLCANGSHKIGMGHIYRMKNLSTYLPRNCEIYFLTANKKMMQNISNSKKIIDLSTPSFVEREIGRINPDVIIVDKLKESTKNLEIFKKNSKFVIGIDYVDKNRNLLDFGISILYHKTALSSIDLKNTFDFTILKKSFLKNKKIKIRKKVNSILVLQGGSDTHCFIPKILKAMNMLHNIKITVIVGSGFKCWNELNKSINSSKNKITVLQNISNINNVMSKHDLAITAGGMTLLELAYLGIPSIIVCGEKFEEETALQISKMGFGINLGYGKKVSVKQLVIFFNSLSNNYQTRQKMNRKGRQIINGKGGFKISQLIQNIGSNL